MFKYIVLLSIAFVGIAIALLGVGQKQSAGVTGTLMCDSSPAANVLVKLYDNNAIGLDGFMGQTTTDSQGHFQVSGYATDITSLDPKVNIYHDCHNSLPCQLKVTISIPHSYVSTGTTPQQYYNLGTYNLAGRVKGTTRDCLHK